MHQQSSPLQFPRQFPVHLHHLNHLPLQRKSQLLIQVLFQLLSLPKHQLSNLQPNLLLNHRVCHQSSLQITPVDIQRAGHQETPRNSLGETQPDNLVASHLHGQPLCRQIHQVNLHVNHHANQLPNLLPLLPTHPLDHRDSHRAVQSHSQPDSLPLGHHHIPLIQPHILLPRQLILHHNHQLRRLYSHQVNQVLRHPTHHLDLQTSLRLIRRQHRHLWSRMLTFKIWLQST